MPTTSRHTAMPIRPFPCAAAAAAASLLIVGVGLRRASQAEEPAPPAQPARASEPAPGEADRKWVSLFDGKSLDGWKPSDFAGAGDVTVAEGLLTLAAGNDMTGVTVDREVPKVDYEIELEAQRVAGSDFFCGLTFPVEDRFCSLILGGWGGGVVGLSSLNGSDASENQTSSYKKFENGKWYAVRLRVTGQRITAWLDGEEIVDADVRDTKLSTRLEVEPSKPLGVASWRTKSALRKVRLRELKPEEVAAANAELEAEE